jgi:two-component system chemotaxis sensor kinase CheA
MRGRANVDSLGVQDLHHMVFEAGFSTADKVTELSGRGVGMDVVRRNVEDLHGTVEIESVEGAGTTVELRLPLSLSVIEGFWIDVAGTEYVLPLDDVIECLELTPYLRAVAEREGIINVRGDSFAYVDLRNLLDTADDAGASNRSWWFDTVRSRVGLGVGAIRASGRRSSSRWGGCSARWPASRARPCGGRSVAFVIDVAGCCARSLDEHDALRSETTAIRGPAEI